MPSPSVGISDIIPITPKKAKITQNTNHSGWDDFVKPMDAKLPFAIMTDDCTFPREYDIEVPTLSHKTSNLQLLPSADKWFSSMFRIFYGIDLF